MSSSISANDGASSSVDHRPTMQVEAVVDIQRSDRDRITRLSAKRTSTGFLTFRVKCLRGGIAESAMRYA